MRQQPSILAIAWLVALVVVVPAGSTVAQTIRKKPQPASQQDDVEKIRELKRQIEALMEDLPPEVQADLRNELGISRPSTGGVGFVAPVSPVTVGLQGPSSGSAGDDVAAATATEFLVLDIRGDGFDLGGRATIRVGGSRRESNWTRPGTDDAFLMVDSGRLRTAGFDLRGGDGTPVTGRVLVSDGVLLQTPDGREVVVADPWTLLSFLDANRDGGLDRRDPAWLYLVVFVDGNGDGAIQPGEIRSMDDVTARRLDRFESAPRQDPDGNALKLGTFERTDGTTGMSAEVELRR